MDTHHHQDDNDLAAAAAAALDAPQFHHALQQPDFSAHHQQSHQSQHQHHNDDQQQQHNDNTNNNKPFDDQGVVDLDHELLNHGHDDQGLNGEIDVHDLHIPDDVGHDNLDLDLGMGTPHDVDLDMGINDYRRPPTIRKACDLCHAAKQKCSGDRPTCTRCAAGGWQCVYAPRQRRRTVPKEQRGSSVTHDQPRSQTMSIPPPQQMIKKRKMTHRDSSFGDGIDMQRAMGMAIDMGLAAEEEGEEMVSLTDDQMLEHIAIDGYLADLPLSTFVHNLPYQPAPQNENQISFNPDDFPAGDMDQHTTSALREAIFSLHESGGGGGGHVEGQGDHQDGDGANGHEEPDPHLALLDLTMPGEDNNDNDSNPLSGLGNFQANITCNHATLIPHVLSLLASQPLEPKSGANTPLTLSVFSPLARSLRLFNSVTSCPNCSASPHQTLPQLALLSRTTTILTFPFPPIEPASGQTAQIQIHGARLAGTGVSQAIEQHIVGVIWDSWRASVREIFAAFERKAQEVITQTAMANANNGDGNQTSASSSETQRAGLMFQAMSRLVTAMDEVEG